MRHKAEGIHLHAGNCCVSSSSGDNLIAFETLLISQWLTCEWKPIFRHNHNERHKIVLDYRLSFEVFPERTVCESHASTRNGSKQSNTKCPHAHHSYPSPSYFLYFYSVRSSSYTNIDLNISIEHKKYILLYIWCFFCLSKLLYFIRR